MKETLLHIFRNNPFGRETLMQSAYFCKHITSVRMNIYIPKQKQFLMYFDQEIVTLDLDASYLQSAKNAKENVDKILEDRGVDYIFYEPKDYTASTLPNIPTTFSYMTCPRSIIDSVSTIGLGHIGTRVRQIAQHARFPVFLTTPVFKKWEQIIVYFGGSRLGCKAVALALDFARKAKMPLTIFCNLDSAHRNTYESNLEETGLTKPLEQYGAKWIMVKKGKLVPNLFNIPSDALVIMGVASKKSVKSLLFGSNLEIVQKTLPNPILLVGPRCDMKEV